MININNNIFHITTKNTAYIMKVTPSGLLLHNYYGIKVPFYNYHNIDQKLEGGVGTACLYEDNEFEFIDNMDLEASFIGKGDYRESLLCLFNDKLGFTSNFKYQGYQLVNEIKESLPMSYDANEVLRIDLFDDISNIKLELYYKVFYDSDVITKYSKLINIGKNTFELTKLMSSQLDLNESDFVLMTFDGAWSKERHLNEKPLTSGIYVNDSKCGISSDKHNPFFILRKNNTTEDEGIAYGFNLVYSGNHASILEVTTTKKLRVLSGINPFCFKYIIEGGQDFTSPEAVLTYTNKGLNRLSQNMHDFINNHIIRGVWKNKLRPILINNWEATYFNFHEKKLLELAKVSKSLGIELFVLDDGWFGNRNDDKSSLGDWEVNTKKLPQGLKGLSEKINKLGLMFGLWVEPEMINEKSNLYRLHPEYAVKIPGRKPSLGRNQLLIDLTNPEVRDYLVDKLSQVFSSCHLEYVKWDFNRKITDMYGSTIFQGEFFHRYILGLYDVLEKLTKLFPDILFESCASGGARFDLGMLCYMPQVWTSDDTDYLERVYIQTGTSYAYPLSTMGAHVSAIPNHQTLRNTSLESRYNIASFGLLGYELDLTVLDEKDKHEIRKQITLYKENRQILQFGKLYRGHKNIFKDNNAFIYVVSNNKAVLGFFQSLVHPSQPEDIIRVNGLNKDTLYHMTNIKQKINLKIFGGLINLVSPIKVKLNGKIHNLICKVYKPNNANESYLIYGKALKYAGIRLHQQFMGTGYNDKVRVLGDFGSRMYIIKEYKDKK